MALSLCCGQYRFRISSFWSQPLQPILRPRPFLQLVCDSFVLCYAHRLNLRHYLCQLNLILTRSHLRIRGYIRSRKTAVPRSDLRNQQHLETHLGVQVLIRFNVNRVAGGTAVSEGWFSTEVSVEQWQRLGSWETHVRSLAAPPGTCLERCFGP